jgi:hypothetical protein
MNEIGLDDVIWPGTVAGESGWIVLAGTITLITDVGNCTDGDSKDAVCRCGDAAPGKLLLRARIVEKRRRDVIAGADDE